MKNRLVDKVAVVIGGGQTPGEDVGNGRAISIKLAQEGAKVVVVARHYDSAQDTVDLIRNNGGEACAYEMDMRDEEACKRLFYYCKKEYGKVDVLVVNASVVPYGEGGIDVASDYWDFVMETNVKGMLFLIRSVAPYMNEIGKGAIVVISSTAACCNDKNKKNSLCYSISKNAQVYLAEQLALKYAVDGIRINSLILGPLKTSIGIEQRVLHGQNREQVIEQRNRYVPLKGETGDAWDTANAVAFLVSDDAKFITGASLPIDGGVSLVRG